MLQKCFDSWERLPGSTRRYAPDWTDDDDVSRRQFDKSHKMTRNGANLSNSEVNSRSTYKEFPIAKTWTKAFTLQSGELNSFTNFVKTFKGNSLGVSIVVTKGDSVWGSKVYSSSQSFGRGSLFSDDVKNSMGRYGGGIFDDPVDLDCDDVTLSVVFHGDL